MPFSRRTFFRWATGLGSALSAALVGVPALQALFSPAYRKKGGARWIKLGEAEQFETGVPIRIDFAETVNDAWVETRVLRGVWIYTEDAETFRVYNGRCTHLACSYGFDQEQGIFHCPCHHGLFELKTGQVLGGPPPRGLDTLETRIEDGILYAAFQDFRAGIPDKIVVG
jgi:menaquinol-cytochrome c reductase iron-sulfur subunit